MQIFVNIDGGKTIALEVSPMDTIDNIKVKIKDKEGLMLDSYTLKYNNREVEEGRTLNDYDIKNESTLYLVTLQALQMIPLEEDAEDGMSGRRPLGIIRRNKRRAKFIRYAMACGVAALVLVIVLFVFFF
ncbi:hypothetical protein EMCRGX_G028880 [Ephydatia muelleri]